MIFRIQPDATKFPIYEQIVAQVIYSIASGDLEPGALIPSIRELAPQLVVHPNTVVRAYQELERRGLVVSRRGLGMEVTASAPKLARQLRQEIVRGRIREALHDAVTSALPPDEVRMLVEEELARTNGLLRKRQP